MSFQSVKCCLIVAIVMIHNAIGQLDSLGDPPAPLPGSIDRYYFGVGVGRRNYERPLDISSLFWNAFQGTWLRTNFQDWIGTKQDQKVRRPKDPSNFPEWFETTKEDRSCSNVPVAVNAGRPPSDICSSAQANDRRCVCIKQQGSRRGEYKPVCGQCRDPCALRFIPRSSTEYLQKLTLGDNSNDEDEDEIDENID